MKNKKSVVFFFMFVLVSSLLSIISISSTTYAIEFVDFTATPVSNKIYNGESAEFILTTENHQTTKQGLIISVTDFNWVVETEPKTDYTTGIFLNPHQIKNTTLFLRPRKEISPGLYNVKISMYDPNGFMPGIISEIVSIRVLPEDLSRYDTNLTITPDIPRYIDPREPISIKIEIQNNNKKPLKDIKIELKSNLINKETSVSLDGNEQKTIEFTVDLKGKKPQKDVVSIIIKEGDSVLKKIIKDIEIASYTSSFEITENSKNSFMIIEKEITLKNTDNIERKENYVISTNLFNSLFTKMHPSYTSKSVDGLKINYFVPVQLGVGEQTTIRVRTNFYPLFFLAIAIILIYILYFIFRSPLVVIKKIQHVKTHEGGIAEMKIILYIKNRARYKLENIVLIDKIPNIALVGLKNELDMIEPKLYHTKDKRKFVKWVLDDFEGGEERILTYKIKTKLAVVGDFSLEPAIAQYEIGAKKSRVYSNSVKISNLIEESNE